MRQFAAFVQSSFFNKHADVIKLVAIITPFAPAFSAKQLDRKTLFAKLFAKEKFSQKKLDYVFSYTLQLLERYFTYVEFEEEHFLQNIFLMRYLRQKSLYKQYSKIQQKATLFLENDTFTDNEHYYARFLFAKEATDFYNQRYKHEIDDNIQLKSDNLDIYYFSEKLKDACEMLARIQVLKTDYRLDFIPEIIDYLTKNYAQFKDYPAIMVYFKVYQLLWFQEKNYFFELKQLIEKHITCFKEDEQRSIFVFAQNYCIKQVNKGDSAFLQELFIIYQQLLANGLLYENQQLSEWQYKNIVAVGLRLKEFVWTKQFIESQLAFLTADSAANAYDFNIASYYYSIRNYDEALQHLVNVEFTDIRYNLGAKALLLRIYYDLNESDALFALFESFKKYLTRNHLISQPKYQRHYNLVKFAQQAYKLKLEKAFVSTANFVQEKQKLQHLLESEDVSNADWLLEKVEDL